MNKGFDSTTDDILDGVDLSGRTAVVTGASGGLGLETARALASCGAEVVVAARNPDKIASALSTLRAEVSDAEVHGLTLDLASLDQIRTAGAELSARHDSIDLLINNAGVMACPLGRTTDGFELQFGTNHLGHFFFAALVSPAMGAGSRLVSLSSSGHRQATVDLDDPNYENREYDKWQAYGQSKTANIWFASEYQRRFGDQGRLAFSVHPGVIMTDLGRHLDEADFKMFDDRPGPPIVFKTIPQGAATSVWAATAPELAGHAGAYLEDCSVAEASSDPDAMAGYQDWAYDVDGAARLWSLSEELVGQSFG